MTYYDDLTKDEKRVSIFKEAITNNAHGITFDLGTGSGILASFASKYAKKVYAFEINPLVIKKYTKNFLEPYENVTIIEADASICKFDQKADVIICEMLDTALIDEEQALVINNVLNYTNENTIFIPKSTYDTISIGNSKISHITYKEDESTEFIPYSYEIKYNEVDFSKKIKTQFKKDIEIDVNKSGKINCILITTYTLVTDKLIIGPTPMLNPPLLIPLNETQVNKGDKVIIYIEYTMGGGLNTIRANIKRIV